MYASAAIPVKSLRNRQNLGTMQNASFTEAEYLELDQCRGQRNILWQQVGIAIFGTRESYWFPATVHSSP